MASNGRCHDAQFLRLTISKSRSAILEAVAVDQIPESAKHGTLTLSRATLTRSVGKNPVAQTAERQALQVHRAMPSQRCEEKTFAAEHHGLQSTDFLNPDDIATTTVLKDAASASIYGARAANGVMIQIWMISVALISSAFV